METSIVFHVKRWPFSGAAPEDRRPGGAQLGGGAAPAPGAEGNPGAEVGEIT